VLKRPKPTDQQITQPNPTNLTACQVTTLLSSLESSAGGGGAAPKPEELEATRKKVGCFIGWLIR
jgi:hypothetical protein